MGQGSSVQRGGVAAENGLDESRSSREERSSSVASTGKNLEVARVRVAKQRPRYGSVDVHVTSVSNMSRSRPQPISVSYSLNSMGGLIHGSACDPHAICNAFENANMSDYQLSPNYISLSDSKAESTLVAFTGDSWYAIPSKEVVPGVDEPTFEGTGENVRSSPSSGVTSATFPITTANMGESNQSDRRNSLLTSYRNHTTCLVLGDKTERGHPQIIRLGDRLRLGSVGLVVSAIRYNGEPEQVLDRGILRLHMDHQSVVLTEEDEENMAILAAYEAEEGVAEQQDDARGVGEALKKEEEMEAGYISSSGGESGASSPVDSDEKDGAPSSSTRQRSETEATDFLDGDFCRGSGPPSPPAVPRLRHPDSIGIDPHSASSTAPASPLTGQGQDTEGKEQQGEESAVGGSNSGDSASLGKGACGGIGANKLGLTRGERFICYMCYETHDTALDPLVAPCECRGDTRYLHVRCLQRWFHSSMPTMPDGLPALQRADGRPLLDDYEEEHSPDRASHRGSRRGSKEAEGEDEVAGGGEDGKSDGGEDDDEGEQYRLAMPQVVRTASNGSLACKICGSAYKTSFRRKRDGKKKDILLTDNVAPYMVLTVVTRHDGNPDLYNTRFRINFTTGWQDMLPGHSRPGTESVIVGRSSNCDMVLDYRTVSTTHARISYHHDPSATLPPDTCSSNSNGKHHSPKGCFVLEDLGSSNGTMLHLLEALPLRYDENVRLRMGRCNVSLKPRRNRLASARYRLAKLLGAGIVTEGALIRSEKAKAPHSPGELQDILGRATDSSRISPAPSTLNSPHSNLPGSPGPGTAHGGRAAFRPRSPHSSPRREQGGPHSPSRTGFRVLGAGDGGGVGGAPPASSSGLAPPSHHVFTGLLRNLDRDPLSAPGPLTAGTSAGASGGGAIASSEYIGRYTGSSLGARMSRAVNPQSSTGAEQQEQEQKQEQEQEQEQEQQDDPGLLVPPLALTLDQRGLSQPPPAGSAPGSARRLSARDMDKDKDKDKGEDWEKKEEDKGETGGQI